MVEAGMPNSLEEAIERLRNPPDGADYAFLGNLWSNLNRYLWLKKQPCHKFSGGLNDLFKGSLTQSIFHCIFVLRFSVIVLALDSKFALQCVSRCQAKLIYWIMDSEIGRVMDHLHWRTLRDNAGDNAGDSDTYCTCLGHLGYNDIKRNNPICVAMPKVAKARKQGLLLSPALSH
jgi:hypothetical protein